MHQVVGKPDPREEPLLPISRGPFDVLCYIFEICGEKNYRTTLKIALVSRHWRDIVLATPRAWAFVDIEACRHEELIKLYLERSSPRPLHISVPFKRDIRLFNSVTDRIRCLSIWGRHADNLGEATFPNVTRLTITSRNARIQDSITDFEAFPALRHLVFEPSWRLWSSCSSLPPLKSLCLLMVERLDWISFLTGCKGTLASLKVIIPNSHPALGVSFLLPRLKCLEIQRRKGAQHSWPLNLKTPELTTFIEAAEGPYSGLHFHKDLENVQYMQTDRLPPLSLLPKLRILQLDAPPTVGEAVLDKLLKDFALCPELTQIDQVVGKVGKMKQKLAEVNKSRPTPIRLRSVIRAEDLPGVIPNSCSPGCYVNDTVAF